MASSQLRLFPAPQPLVERLGVEWFRQLPTLPGVYRFLDAENRLLYVGKARNLRQRLAAYRTTTRHHPRIIRLIHAATRIEWETLPSESEALSRESESILRDQPRFNRAGRWKAPPVWFEVHFSEGHCTLQCRDEPGEGRAGPYPRGQLRCHLALARLLWLACHPDATASDQPLNLAGTRQGSLPITLPPGRLWQGWIESWLHDANPAILWELASLLEPRIQGFTGAWILDSWEQASRAIRLSPGGVRTG